MDFCICDLCQCCAFNIFFLIKTLVPVVHKKSGWCSVSEHLSWFLFVSLFSIYSIARSFCNLSLTTGDPITDIFSVYVFLASVPLHVLIFLLAPVFISRASLCC